MFNLKKREELVKEFFAAADANMELVKTYGNLSEAMAKDDVGGTRYLINKIADYLAASVPAGLDVPALSVHTNMSGAGNMISTVDLAVRNKNSSNIKFRFTKQVVYSENVFEVVVDFFKVSLVELITDALIRANLEEVNAKFAQISEEAGNTFKVTIVPPMGNGGRKVVSITDDEIVLVADETRILSMDDILIFFEADEYVTEEKIEAGYKEAVAQFAKAQTTPQFLGVHEPTVGYICDISNLVKPITIIKKVYSKNVKNIKRMKETMAYFNNGEVFSVIAVNPDGYDVALKPFNIETLEVVDFDVVEAI